MMLRIVVVFVGMVLSILVGVVWLLEVTNREPTATESPIDPATTDPVTITAFSSKDELLRALRELPPDALRLVGYVDENGNAAALTAADIEEWSRATLRLVYVDGAGNYIPVPRHERELMRAVISVNGTLPLRCQVSFYEAGRAAVASAVEEVEIECPEAVKESVR